MTRARWLAIVAGCGAAIFALSFVNGWIVHDRELRGEGYRHAQITLSAWRNAAVPVLSAASVAALGVALAALALVRGRFRVGWPLVIGSAVALGLMLASAWPIEHRGHTSSVELSIGWLLVPGLALAVVMLAASVAAARPSPRILGAAAGIGLLVLVGGGAGRWFGLQAAEGSGRHWSHGSYTRPPAAAGSGAQTLTIRDGRITIGDRWSASFESSGWTVVLDDDPACPDSRGTYHAHGEADEALRFVMVVDTCADGARAADLEAGIWQRDR